MTILLWNWWSIYLERHDLNLITVIASLTITMNLTPKVTYLIHKSQNAPVSYSTIFHWKQYRNVHISILNETFWDMEQVHSGICEIGLFTLHCIYFMKSTNKKLYSGYHLYWYSIYHWPTGLVLNVNVLNTAKTKRPNRFPRVLLLKNTSKCAFNIHRPFNSPVYMCQQGNLTWKCAYLCIIYGLYILCWNVRRIYIQCFLGKWNVFK